jgi:hypothetical protein
MARPRFRSIEVLTILAFPDLNLHQLGRAIGRDRSSIRAKLKKLGVYEDWKAIPRPNRRWVCRRTQLAE